MSDPIQTRDRARLRGFIVLAAAVLMQLCLGATYAWPVFVQPFKAQTGLSQGSVQLPFTLFYVVFPATMFFAGRVIQRFGLRTSAMAGGILFGGGWFFAGMAGNQFAFVALGVGVLGGLGAGLAYLVPIATAVKWFPRHAGLVTGISVAGFGGGAALVSQAATHLMVGEALGPLPALRILGLVFALVILLAASQMRAPTEAPAREAEPRQPLPLVPRRSFIALYLAMFTGLAAGFTVNANLRELAFADRAAAGAVAVSLFALANAAGRIVWGFLHDRFPNALPLQVNLWCQAALLLLFSWSTSTLSGYYLFAFLAGFNYGGILVLYASSVARQYGSASFPRVYGRLFSANIPAALAPMAVGYAFEQWNSFAPAFAGLALIMIIASAGLKTAGRS
ncbi:MAG: MFS transporter [Candidatus Hydrogenedentes bacterium]|nr:MFS transporter [Candidatus Hydrogenedentota bacterium]